jgi:alpha-mannosidase
MWNFAGVSDGKQGLAVINDGLTEYEAVDDEPRTIAVTLLRAFGRFVFDRPVPEAQCPGKHTYNFAIYPHEGEWSDSNIFMETAEFITPLQAVESAPSRGKGPLEESFFSLISNAAVFSGIKQGEDGESVIIRFWNPYSIKKKVTLKTGKPVKDAFSLTLEEKRVKELKVDDDNIITFTASPKKIITTGLRF